jgi:hypothetical protein
MGKKIGVQIIPISKKYRSNYDKVFSVKKRSDEYYLKQIEKMLKDEHEPDDQDIIEA